MLEIIKINPIELRHCGEWLTLYRGASLKLTHTVISKEEIRYESSHLYPKRF